MKRIMIFIHVKDKKQSVASTALKKFKIEVSKDGSNWTTVKEGTLD